MSQPLSAVRSIKVKLGALVGVSVLVAAVVGVVAERAGVPVLLAVPVTVALALGITQLLAVGMTAPLREMTSATEKMAHGDYRGRVRAESNDEIGELARAFNQMAAELASVDREQRDLVATVSHELRTPVAALAATLENLADGVRPADAAELGKAADQAQRVGTLLNDLLELSRLEAAPLRAVRVDLVALLDEVIADLVPTGRGVAFDVEAPDGTAVRADRTRLRQLLANVLENAVRHSPEGGRVTVRYAATPVGWQLDVADQGPGVDREHRERVFERFGTLTSPEGHQGGTGLGLAIARWVAELHGGTLSFLDPPAGGALVRLHLPLDPATTPQEVPVPTETEPVETPPVFDPFWGRFWPDVAGTHRGVLLAAAGVGVLAGLVLPNHSAGLAVLLVALTAGLTVAYAARHRAEPFTLTCLVLAGLCTLPIVLLDAVWIGVLCLLAGASALIAGLCRVRRFHEFLLAGLSWPLAGLRDLPWAGRTVRSLTGHGNAPRVVVTGLVSALVLLVFGLLFVSADAIVASWVDVVLPDVTVDSVVLRVFVAVAVAGATLAAAYLALNPPRVDLLPDRRRSVAHRFEWLVPVLLVDAVFALFVAAQLSVLFGGHDYVQSTTGLTYAEYVHQGFAQLTIATLLTFVVVRAAAHWAGEDRGWLLASLGLLCALTLVVVGSALYRMHLYQEAYGFSRLRLFVDVFEGWLGLLVVAVAVAGVLRWGRWVPRFALVTGVAGLLGLAALNPDAWIAEHNLDRYADTARVDWFYLRELSADAVPVFADRSEQEIACGLPRFWDQDEDWLAWNLGRSRATGVVQDSEAMGEALDTATPYRDDVSAADCPAG